MNLLDYIIIGVLILSALLGFKKGFINSVVAFAGTILVIILAFYFKNPISQFMYERLPFFGLSGSFEGMNIISILIYEGVSFLITIIILSFILGIIVKITGVFNKLVHATVILTLPSKLLGMICGFIEGYILAFIIIFALGLIAPSSSLLNESKYGELIATKTPILSKVGENTYNTINDVYQIAKNYKDSTDKTSANREVLGVLLKYEIISVDSADKLVEKGKLEIDGAKDIIDIYRKDNL